MRRDPLVVDTFQPVEPASDPLAVLMQGLFAPRNAAATPASPPVVEIATLHGFDLDDRPVLRGIASLPGELVVARTTITLRSEAIGESAVVVFERGDPHRPIVLGMLMPAAWVAPIVPAPVTVRIDDAIAERLVLRAEREIVLECGDASITLTRAGKVLIRGHYILSRASGYNRIKGAAIDIN